MKGTLYLYNLPSDRNFWRKQISNRGETMRVAFCNGEKSRGEEKGRVARRIRGRHPESRFFSPSPIKGKEPPCWTELPSFIVRAGGWWWWCHQRKLHGAFYVTNSGVAWHLLVADSLNEPFALVMPLDNRVAPAAQLVPSFLSLPSSLPSFPLRVNKTRLLPPLFREGIIVKFVGRRRVKSCWSSRGCKISREEGRKEGEERKKLTFCGIIITIGIGDGLLERLFR